MNLINQPTSETGCGIACFAMISRLKKYDSAKKKMKDNSWALQNDYVLVKQMKLAIEAINPNKNIELHNREPNNSATCVLFVKYRDIYRHWIVRHNNLYYDPLPKYKKPRKNIGYTVTRAISIND